MAFGLGEEGLLEDFGRGDLDLVEDEQPPLDGAELVDELFGVGRAAFVSAGDHGVGGDDDAAFGEVGDDSFLAGVRDELVDLALRERAEVEGLLFPLLDGDVVDTQDERATLHAGHRDDAHQRLARAARQHDDAGARTAFDEHAAESLLLVRPDLHHGLQTEVEDGVLLGLALVVVLLGEHVLELLLRAHVRPLGLYLVDLRGVDLQSVDLALLDDPVLVFVLLDQLFVLL